MSPELLDSFKRIDGVSEVTAIGGNQVRLLLSKDFDVRPALARLAVANGSLLLSCEIEETSLEDLFISLVKRTS